MVEEPEWNHASAPGWTTPEAYEASMRRTEKAADTDADTSHEPWHDRGKARGTEEIEHTEADRCCGIKESTHHDVGSM